MVPLGLEPRTFCVQSRRDNHYTTGPISTSHKPSHKLTEEIDEAVSIVENVHRVPDVN